jgi:hypothetical protein
MSEFEPPRQGQLVSMGYLCGLLQITPSQLKIAMREVRVTFSLCLDGVGLLRVADAEAVAKKVAELHKEIRDGVEKVRAAARNN